jgi:hypothetical protein
MASAMAKNIYGAKKDANHGEIVAAFEKMGCQCLDLSSLGGGVPDLLVWHKSTNRAFMVDVKNPKTGYGRRGLNRLQLKWAESWTASPIYLVYSDLDAERLVRGEYRSVKSHGGDDEPFVRLAGVV